MLVLSQRSEFEAALGEDPERSAMPAVLQRRAADEVTRCRCQCENLVG